MGALFWAGPFYNDTESTPCSPIKKLLFESYLEPPRVELRLVGVGREVGPVGELVLVEVDAGRPHAGVAHDHGQGLANHLVLGERFVHDPCAGEDLLRVDDLEVRVEILSSSRIFGF